MVSAEASMAEIMVEKTRLYARVEGIAEINRVEGDGRIR